MATNLHQVKSVLMCPPDHFCVNYEINPWMRLTEQPEEVKARNQWEQLRRTIENCGTTVQIVEPDRHYPDMVFTANAALVRGNRAFLAHFKYEERDGERIGYGQWLRDHNFEVIDDTEYYFEGAGDALFAGNKLFAAYGWRSDRRVYSKILRTLSYWSLDAEDPENLGAARSDIELIDVELRDPRFYHLDTCFCPITPHLAIWFPRAFTPASQERIRRAGLELIEVPENEATRFACNSIALGKHVITPEGAPKTKEALEARGFLVHSVDVCQFLKAGGSCKCLILYLDHEQLVP